MAEMYRGNPYSMMVNTATATLISRSTGAPVNVSVPYAKKTEVTDDDVAASGGFLSVGDVFIDLPSPSTEPKKGDGITLGGVTWSVLRIQTVAWGNVYKCSCRKER